jgi:hypothetical protein
MPQKFIVEIEFVSDGMIELRCDHIEITKSRPEREQMLVGG